MKEEINRYKNEEKIIRQFLKDSETYTFDEILEELGALYQADRAYIFEDDSAKGISTNTHEWCREGVVPQIDNLQALPLEDIAYVEEIIKEKEFIIHSLKDDLEESDPVYQILEPQDIQSLIIVPLMIGGEISGYIGVDNPKENMDMTLFLSVASTVIGSKILFQRQLAFNDESFLVLSKLREQYATMYYVDLKTDYMHTYKTNENYNDKYGLTEYYSESMGAYVKYDIAQKDRERMIEATNPKNVMERFQKEDSFILEFEDHSFGDVRYCQLNFIKANEDGSQAIVLGSDRTKEKKEEKQKAEALEEMQDIIDASGMGTWHIELVEGKEARMSADGRMMELLGLSDQQMTAEEIYHAWFDHIDSDAVQSVLDSVEKMEKIGRDENTYLWNHPTLGKRYVRCGGTARPIEGGYVLRGYHYDVDDIVREQKKQDELLKDALNAAEHANRAKTTFLNNMSHDIRTPMNAIIGYTNLASTHIDCQEQVQDYLSKITVSSSHLLSLINDVLDMSRIESGKVSIEEKEANLPEILHDVRTITQANIHAKQLDFFIDTVDVVHENIICDQLRLNQILLNILSNATKFTQPGGSISLRIMEKPCQLVDYAAYEFHIKDTGIGMSKEFQEHIFEPFTREQTSTVSGIQGTGLGMAITKNIVDMMGGTIEVESEEGKGSEFIVSVQFRINGEPVKQGVIPELEGVRALVADDDADTAISVNNMMKCLGLRSDWTLSGKEAVLRAKVAFQENDAYGIYIIDWLMPDMNGIETVRQIRRYVKEPIPIIILSAYDWSDIEQEAKEAGVTAFVSKPIFLSELKNLLTKPVLPIEKEVEEEIDFSGKKLLLVEDNQLNQEIAVELLSQYNFTIDVVGDGLLAVERLEKAKKKEYDLVLMDIQLPRMDGYEATQAIRNLSNPEIANIPIVAMSANAFAEDQTRALQAGMDGYITKPIEMQKTIEVIRQFM